MEVLDLAAEGNAKAQTTARARTAVRTRAAIVADLVMDLSLILNPELLVLSGVDWQPPGAAGRGAGGAGGDSRLQCRRLWRASWARMRRCGGRLQWRSKSCRGCCCRSLGAESDVDGRAALAGLSAGRWLKRMLPCVRGCALSRT